MNKSSERISRSLPQKRIVTPAKTGVVAKIPAFAGMTYIHYLRPFAMAMVFALLPCVALAAAATCDGGASWIGKNPKLVLAFTRIGTVQGQLCLYLAYFAGLICSAQGKKLSGDAVLNAFGFVFTAIILLVVLHYFGIFIRTHWIWQGILIQGAYFAFFGAFFALWEQKIIWWGGLTVLLAAVVLTGIRMEFIC